MPNTRNTQPTTNAPAHAHAHAHEQETLFAAVDALLEEVAQDPLPHPDERKRLREAAGLSQDQIAKALAVRRETVTSWETGRTSPRPPKRAAYARLLEGLSALHPLNAAINAVNAQLHEGTATESAPVNAVNTPPPGPARERPTQPPETEPPAPTATEPAPHPTPASGAEPQTPTHTEP
ncbi:helix-turn-helix transcriptional regulator, partial [Streptomyces sp. NPDC057011]